MPDDQPIGLTPDQHYAVGQLVARDRAIIRRQQPAGRPTTYPGVARVLCLGDDDPVYTPRSARDVAVFRWNPTGAQVTVELSGTDLQGQLDVSVGEVTAIVDCQVTTAELRTALGISLKDCRITVFPGLWEFDFNHGRWSASAPTVSVTPHEPEEENDDAPVFDGGLRVVNEGWVSITPDGDTYVTAPTTDWIPHLSGAIKAGAIGAAVWSHEAGWLVLAWQCREWSFAI